MTHLMTETHDWIFTFGVNDAKGRNFVRINSTYDGARDEMVRRFGKGWAFQYPSEEDAGVERFGLTELPGWVMS